MEYQTLAFEEVEAFRCLGCSAYSICLDYANQQRWDSFTCAGCPYYDQGGIAPHMSVPTFGHEPEEPI